MAGQSDLLNKLKRLFASFDDGAFVALANKGLVRRARKDLDAGVEIILDAETEESVQIRVAEVVVTIGEEGPAKARCSCPAADVCRHVLCACMFLKSTADQPAEDAGTTLREELLAYSIDALVKWGGKRTMRDALTVLANNSEVEIEEADSVRVRFPKNHAECRYFRGAGLDGMIPSSKVKNPKRFLIAAVLAYQRKSGVTLDLGEEAPRVLAEATGAPRTREEVVRATWALLKEMLGAGLSHLSESSRQRLVTLSVSATGVNLPRLALSLRSLADDVALLLARHASANEARLFASMARAYALGRALEIAGTTQPSADLIGWHRTRYDEVGTLDLLGVGAYTWQTKSGFAGLTVLFREEASSEWYSWSAARPQELSERFEPAKRYLEEGPWAGVDSPKRACRTKIKLYGARKNPRNRLSASTKSRGLVVGDTDPATVDFKDALFTNWTALEVQAAKIQPVGLRERNPLDALVVIKPTAFKDRSFDEIEQRFEWAVEDDEGRTLRLWLPYSEADRGAIDRLERLRPQAEGVWGVLGRLTRIGEAIGVHPLAIYRTGGEGAVLNLDLDGVASKELPTESAVEQESAWAEVDEEESDDAEDLSHGGVRRVRGFEEALEEIAESGTRGLSRSRRERLKQASGSLGRAGLSILARYADALASARSVGVPDQVLKARYLCELHRQLFARDAQSL